MSEVVKVQIPIVGPKDVALVYDRERRHIVQQPLTSYLVSVIGPNQKAFFDATWQGKYWRIGGIVKSQEW